MKKIFIAIAAIAAMTLASCDGTTAKGGDNDSIATDSITIEETNVVEAKEKAEALVKELANDVKEGNTDKIAAKIKEAQAYLTELLNNGDKEAIKSYATKIKEFVEANKDKINEIKNGDASISELLNIANLSDKTQDIISAAASAIGTNAESLKDVAKSAVQENINDKVDETKESVKNKVNESIDNAKEDVKNKANEAISNAASKAADASKKAADNLKKDLGI